MQLCVMLEPQMGLRYSDILAVARRAEERKFAALFRSDHYASSGAQPATDCWATLAGLARDTEHIGLGSLASPATFHHPVKLAKTVATVAEMAGAGRVELGIGTGWHEGEHQKYGFPFLDTAARFRRLGEHLQVIRNLWDPGVDEFTFDGEFIQLADAHFSPTPDPTPRIIVGGQGTLKTPRLAAAYADELNTFGATADQCRERRAALDRFCEQAGRDPAEVGFSVMAGCVVGEDEDAFAARMRRLGKLLGRDVAADELAPTWIVGTPEQAADRIGELAAAGVGRLMLQHLLHDDLDMLDLVADEVAPKL